MDHDIVNALQALNLDYVREEGYTNLRYNPKPGCDHFVEPHKEINTTGPLTRDDAAEVAWLEAWQYLLKDVSEEAPLAIGTACCAQFAVSRDQILTRPLRGYLRYHRWLIETPMSDEISGRIMEYAWHMIFGEGPIQQVKLSYLNSRDAIHTH